MASERAQKSEVHETSDDASSSPGSDARTPRKGRAELESHGRPATPAKTEKAKTEKPQVPRDEDRDESDFGGPARIETDERGNLKD